MTIRSDYFAQVYAFKDKQIIKVLEVQKPLSFREYLHERAEQGLETSDLEQCYSDYVRFGSLPFTVQLKNNAENVNQYLNGVYNTILLKDISLRHQINDISTLEAVIRFMFANTANICTSKKISDTLTSGGAESQSAHGGKLHALSRRMLYGLQGGAVRHQRKGISQNAFQILHRGHRIAEHAFGLPQHRHGTYS